MNLLDQDAVKAAFETELRHLQAFIDGKWYNGPIEELAIDWEVTSCTEYATCYRYEGDIEDPSWIVRDEKAHWSVEYSHGWYEQMGEAGDLNETIRLMRAMMKASEALSPSKR